MEELAAAAGSRIKSPGQAASSPMSVVQNGSEGGHSPSFKKVRKQASMGADFITAEPKAKQNDADHSWRGRALRLATYIVDNNFNANFLALVVLFDAYLTANDIDARAAGHDASTFVRTCSDICLLLYTAELPLLLFVRGRKILKDWMVLLDIEPWKFSIILFWFKT